jgi:L-rhamnose mutarotase
VERCVVIARLKPEGCDRAHELIAQYPPGEDLSTEFDRYAVFLAEGEVIFFVEGPDAQSTVRNIINDPVRSTWLSHWLPLFDGPLHAAPEEYYWERS